MRGVSQSKGRVKNDAQRKERLAAELRANLAKRKDRARSAARAEGEVGPSQQRSPE